MKQALAIVLVLALVATAHAQEYLDKKVTVDVTDASIAPIASFLADEAGVTLHIAATGERRVTFALHDVPWKEALLHLAREAKARVAVREGRILIEDRPAPKTVTLPKGTSVRRAIAQAVRAGGFGVAIGPEAEGILDEAVTGPWPEALAALLGPRGLHASRVGDVIVVGKKALAETLDMNGPGIEPSVRWPLPTKDARAVNVVVEDAPLSDTAREIGRRVGRTIVVAPGAEEGRVTRSLEETPWPIALATLAEAAHARVRETNGLLVLETGTPVTVEIDAPATTVLSLVATYGARNLIVPPLAEPRPVLVDLDAVDAATALRAIARAAGLELSGGDVLVAAPAALDLPARDPYDLGPDEGELVDLAVEAADVKEVLAAIAERAHANVAVDPTMTDKLSFAVHRLGSRRAFELVARLVRGSVQRIGSVALVEQPPKVTIQFRDANARTVLILLAAYSGKNVLVAPDVKGSLTLDLHEVDWFLALDAIAVSIGAHVSEVVPGILVVTPDVRGPRLSAAPQPAPAWHRPEDPKKSIDVAVVDADLAAVLAAISQQTGVALAVGPDVNEKVTISLKNVDWKDAVDAIAALALCHVERVEGKLVLEQEPRVTLQATDAPARAWFELLGQALGEPVATPPELGGTITCDLHAISFEKTIKATAALLGASTERGEKGFSVGPGAKTSSPEPRRARPAPARPPARVLSREAKAKLSESIDAKLEKIEALALESKVEELMEVMKDLNAIWKEAGPEGVPAARERVAAWKAKASKKGVGGEVVLAVTLQLAIVRGNDELKALLAAGRDHDRELVLEHWKLLQDLCAEMRLEEREEFHRNAEALFLRGKTLVDESEKLSALDASFALEVRALVIDPREGKKNRALLIVDGAPRVIEEGATLEGKGRTARVVKIMEGSIRLSFEGTDFIRELETP